MKTIKKRVLTVIFAFVCAVSFAFAAGSLLPAQKVNAESVTISGVTVDSTSNAGALKLNITNGTMPASMATGGNIGRGGNGSGTFLTAGKCGEHTLWALWSGMIATSSQITIFTAKSDGSAIDAGTIVKIPNGSVLTFGSDSITLGETVNYIWDGSSWEKNEFALDYANSTSTQFRINVVHDNALQTQNIDVKSLYIDGKTKDYGYAGFVEAGNPTLFYLNFADMGITVTQDTVIGFTTETSVTMRVDTGVSLSFSKDRFYRFNGSAWEDTSAPEAVVSVNYAGSSATLMFLNVNYYKSFATQNFHIKNLTVNGATGDYGYAGFVENANSSLFYVQLQDAMKLSVENGTRIIFTADTYIELASSGEKFAVPALDIVYNGSAWTEYAELEKNYTVKKNVDGTVTEEDAVGDYVLPSAEKENCVFLGWAVDGVLKKAGAILSAREEGYEIKAEFVELKQIDGAFVKLGESLNGSGIRFVVKLGDKNEFVKSFGIAIMPYVLLTNGDFVFESYTENVDYLKYETAIADITGVKENFMSYGDGYYLKASVINLYESNYKTEFAARSYITVCYDGSEEVIYTDFTKENNVRRICDIAKTAVDNGNNDPILIKYAEGAQTLNTYGYFAPEVAEEAFKKYAELGADVLWLNTVPYRYHQRYEVHTKNEETGYYDSRSSATDLKAAFALARQYGLKVVVYDLGIRSLSESDIPLVATSSERKVIGMWVQTNDGVAVDIKGSEIDAAKFDETSLTYEYDGATAGGANKAKVLSYIKQFESEAALKEYIANFMSAYAKEINFYGVMLCDEPNASQLAQVALVKKLIGELYPSAYTQTCQLPVYGYNGFAEWKSAVTAYASMDGVKEIGVDFYPFKVANGSWWDSITGNNKTIFDNWLSSYQTLSALAIQNGINFETTIQTHGVENKLRSVSAAEAELQFHMALAFGAKRIGLYTYAKNSGDGTVTQCIAEDSDLYANIQTAIKEARALSDYLTFYAFNGKSALLGGSKNRLNTDNFETFSLTKNVVSSAGAPILVNEFYNEALGAYGYYIVNITDPAKGTSAAITFAGDYKIFKDGAEYSGSSVTLAAGEGAFVVAA